MLGSIFLFQRLFQSLLLLCISELNVLYCRRSIFKKCHQNSDFCYIKLIKGKMLLWFLVVPLNGIKAVRIFCPDCLLDTEISRLSSFAILFPLLYSRGLIRAPIKSVLWGFSSFSWPKRLARIFQASFIHLFFSGVWIDLQGWKVKEGKVHVEEGGHIIS